ncbi:hypothetical protein GCM10011316_22720 [Roseibium aquae]|uniref:Uncharacterized protein n=1 Tax=Roseibium aquae TaxID=1323746 RepID=A0A916TKH9_9HYPH|nr:hypothetical protein [Roseibium aquae]GGB50066.1 hypothetical protein GCM10011316_22720 [Roseibium aquae]
MNLETARCFLVAHRLDYNRDRGRWFPSWLYRLKQEAVPIADTGPLTRPFRQRSK